jgi:Mg2+/Co2+ transporter CorC
MGELFHLELEDEDVDTVGGLLAKALGKVPIVGSTAVVSGVKLTAERLQGRRNQLATVIVARAGSTDDSEDN